MKYAQVVMGAKGCGKSTYCHLLSTLAESKGRKVRIVNLDPKALTLPYEQPVADVRTVIDKETVLAAEEAAPGTGAGLEAVLTYVVDHPEWLFGALGEQVTYVLFDCPGETDHHVHLRTMKVFAAMLVVKSFRTCGVFLREGGGAVDGYGFIGACLTSLTSYINLSIPHLNLITKVDLLKEEESTRLALFINSDLKDVLRFENGRRGGGGGGGGGEAPLARLCHTAASILEGHNFVRKKFYPLDIREEGSLKGFLALLDDVMGITAED